MHPEMEKLISIALKDGIITDKEREILFRKAEKLGIDLDEFEMELEGRFATEGTNSKTPSKTFDKIRKSTYLGDLIEKLQLVDEEIANPKTNISTRIESTINKAIDTLVDNNPVQYGVDAVKSVFGGTTSKEKKVIEKENNEIHRINLLISKKVTIVSSYQLSSELSDLIELVTLCIASAQGIENKYSENWVYQSEIDLMYAWKNKAEQVILNMKLNFMSEELQRKIDELELKLNPPKKKKSFWDKFSL
ncbi:MAG: hypothetical protein ACOYNC_15515 [Bacteroidales bacterium]